MSHFGNSSSMGLPMIEIFLGELSASLPQVREYLLSIQKGSNPKEISNRLLKLIREIKSGATIVRIASLEKMASVFEKVSIREFEKEEPIKQEIFPLLLQMIDLLMSFTQLKAQNFFAYLAQKSDEVDHLTRQLSQLLPEKEMRAYVDQRGLGKKSLADSVDISLLEAFCERMRNFARELHHQVVRIENHETDNPEALAHLAEDIMEATKKLGLFDISKIGYALKGISFPVNERELENLYKTADFFTQLGEVEPVKLTEWLEAHQTHIERIQQELMEYKGEPKEARDKQSVADRMMMDLFQAELDSQTKILNAGLVNLEIQENPEEIAPLLRAAHSIKGAARVVHLENVVQLAHLMEDCFVAAQRKQLILEGSITDALLKAVDLFITLSSKPHSEISEWITRKNDDFATISQEIKQRLVQKVVREDEDALDKKIEVLYSPLKAPEKTVEKEHVKLSYTQGDRVLRVTAQNLNRLMGLAGESMVESRWLQPFIRALSRVSKMQKELETNLNYLRDSFKEEKLNNRSEQYFLDVQHKIADCQQALTSRLAELEMFILRHTSLSDRLYGEVIESRMRPLSDAVEALPRFIRDLARQLDKKVTLEIVGKRCSVDRDILEKLESPLSHILRNAVDHGIELPQERIAAGKSPEGHITVTARHLGGMLDLVVIDDGRGVDFDRLRKMVVDKNLVRKDTADRLSEKELMDFLFLPGFSTVEKVTEISGRGIGLNLIQNLVQEVGGSVNVFSVKGEGFTVHLQLPLTLSVIRGLIVEIAGEPYAFPLGRVDHVLTISQSDVETAENRQYFRFEGQNIGIISAYQILQLQKESYAYKNLCIVILKDASSIYGVVVDGFLGERELVVQDLGENLGKIPNIISGAFMEDGSPILIIDVEDMIKSIDNLLSGGRAIYFSVQKGESGVKYAKKRILVIDDSITVREVECRLLRNRGYEVESAINGVDGWNAIRLGSYDLIVTDVDMPRMNGIELIKLIRNDAKFKDMPVLVVSYKESNEDRAQGLAAGANGYLTKSSFHDETLINAVVGLIGTPEEDESP